MGPLKKPEEPNRVSTPSAFLVVFKLVHLLPFTYILQVHCGHDISWGHVHTGHRSLDTPLKCIPVPFYDLGCCKLE